MEVGVSVEPNPMCIWTPLAELREWSELKIKIFFNYLESKSRQRQTEETKEYEEKVKSGEPPSVLSDHWI